MFRKTKLWMKTLGVAMEFLKERRRQISLGFDASHDDDHSLEDVGNLARMRLTDFIYSRTDNLKEDREILVEAGALIMALVEAFDRQGFDKVEYEER